MTTDDDPPPKKPPVYCPWCAGKVVKRWVPNKLRSARDRTGVRVAYVCLKCKIAVQARHIPPRPLFEIKKAARDDFERARDALADSGFSYASTRDLYARGRCTCPSHPFLPEEPCPVHRPIGKKSARKRAA